MEKRLRVNNRIRIPEVAVIDEEGRQLGVMKTWEALKLAEERGLDLVEVAPANRPPITKFMDYGRHLYEKEKQQKGQKAKMKSQELKAIRMGFRTDKHDMEIKAKKVDKFLAKGNLVMIHLMLKGRERALAHLGREKLVNFLELLTNPYLVIKGIKREGRIWNVTIKPSK